MVITVMPLDGTGAPSYSAQQTRQMWSAFLGSAPPGRPLGALSGVRPGTPSTTVYLSGTGSMTWNVNTHSGVIDAETAAAGPYLYSAYTNSGTITAADATNPRIDIVYVEIDDNTQDGSASEGGVVGYVAGTAMATPTAPSPPHSSRSIVLANISVPASGGGAPTVTWVAPVYGMRGALLVNKAITGYQSIPDSTWTTVGWPNVVSVAGGITYAGVSGMWNVPRDAWYTISASVEFATNGTGTRYLRLMAPNAIIRWSDTPTSGQVCTVGGTISLFIPANTTIYVQAYQSSGNSLAANGDSNLGTVFSVLER